LIQRNLPKDYSSATVIIQTYTQEAGKVTLSNRNMDSKILPEIRTFQKLNNGVSYYWNLITEKEDFGY